LAAFFLTGCLSSQQPPTSLANAPDAFAIRNNGYSLLHQLLDEQKDISILRFIKSEDSPVKILTKKIAAASKKGAKELEAFAKQDPSISLNEISLPPGEVATRDSISKTKESALLKKKGRDFELTLLLTQTEALNYGWHLAEVTAAHETDSGRARALSDLGKEMEALYLEVYNMVLYEGNSGR